MIIDRVLEHFDSVDPVLAIAGYKVRSKLTPIIKASKENYLSDLCESIVSQQLSVKAASTIWARSHAVIPNWNDPKSILEIDPELLRGCGLSYQKVSYVKNIAQAVFDGALQIHQFDSMADTDIQKELTAVKGIGLWTSEMFLIFTLGREDIFSAGDLGLRNAIKKLYGIQHISPSDASTLAEKWQPYRSTACRILWKTLDNEPG